MCFEIVHLIRTQCHFLLSNFKWGQSPKFRLKIQKTFQVLLGHGIVCLRQVWNPNTFHVGPQGSLHTQRRVLKDENVVRMRSLVIRGLGKFGGCQLKNCGFRFSFRNLKKGRVSWLLEVTQRRSDYRAFPLLGVRYSYRYCTLCAQCRCGIMRWVVIHSQFSHSSLRLRSQMKNWRE